MANSWQGEFPWQNFTKDRARHQFFGRRAGEIFWVWWLLGHCDIAGFIDEARVQRVGHLELVDPESVDRDLMHGPE